MALGARGEGRFEGRFDEIAVLDVPEWSVGDDQLVALIARPAIDRTAGTRP